MTELLFKVLDENGHSCNGGDSEWHKPRGRPGKWMPPIEGGLFPCANGYHLCRKHDLVEWVGPTIWLAEYKGDRINSDNKIVVRQARLVRRLNWDARIARHFAADCAYRSLKFFEEKHPGATSIAMIFSCIPRRRMDAAWAAAWAAERKWQTSHLMRVLGI
jgi:hypothetical protein